MPTAIGRWRDLCGRPLATGLRILAPLVYWAVERSLRSHQRALALLVGGRARFARPAGQPVVQEGLVMVREVALVVRLSEEERASWHAAARAAGWGKTAGWVRSVVAAAVSARGGSVPARTGSRTSVPAVDPQVLGELSAIGSNVNQLARAVNAAARGGQPLAVEVAVVEALRVDVLALTAAVKAASTGASSGVSDKASSAGGQR